ncbi:MAG: transposase [Lachnospiraceae bacterium]|nr:transposase [Lachnospiraceae bacterium]
MIKFIDSILSNFKGCFSRTSTYRWFVIVVVGFFMRTEFLGVTSFIRCFSLAPKAYDSLIKFFRSDAYFSHTLRKKWYGIIKKNAPLYQLNGKNLLAGDGTKHPKEGTHIPGVKKLVQESENSSKAQYIFGHMYGGVAAVTHTQKDFFAIPLKMDIQDGLSDTASWDDGCAYRSLSHVVQMINNGYEAAEQMGSSYLVLDRYFLSVPALQSLDRLNQKEHLLDVITRAKNSCVAYKTVDNPPEGCRRRGRPRKKGDAIKLITLFETKAGDFEHGNAKMYGIREPVDYLCIDLLWGAKLYKKIRFVLVKSSKGNCILASSDLELDAVSIIEAYALRFKIECTFREFKQQIGGFCYHFWSKAMPRLKRYRKTGEPSELSQIEDQNGKKLISGTIEAIERFVLFACISMGIIQLMALNPIIADKAKKSRYLRTYSEYHVSEATIIEYMHKHFFRLLLSSPRSELTQIIKFTQEAYSGDENLDIAG